MIHMYFNPGDLERWANALRRADATARLQATGVPRRNAIEYKWKLVNNITQQRFHILFAVYNEGYETWKTKYFGHTKNWVLLGNLLKSIKATKTRKRRPYTWFSGVRYNAGSVIRSETSWFHPPHSGKGKRRRIRISRYGRYGEYGREGQPSRPVFVPTTEEYVKDGWIKVAHNALGKVAQQWH